eukprot:782013-Amphidinium_carterae.3
MLSLHRLHRDHELLVAINVAHGDPLWLHAVVTHVIHHSFTSYLPLHAPHSHPLRVHHPVLQRAPPVC